MPSKPKAASPHKISTNPQKNVQRYYNLCAKQLDSPTFRLSNKEAAEKIELSLMPEVIEWISKSKITIVKLSKLVHKVLDNEPI